MVGGAAKVAGVADLARLDDEQLLSMSRCNERARRSAEAEQVRLLAEIERRALHTIDGHRGVDGWGRAVHRWSRAQAKAMVGLIRLGRAAPEVLDRLQRGQLGVAQAHLLACTFTRPRIGVLLLPELPDMLQAAAELSMAEFEEKVTNWRLLVDQDGADPSRSMRARSATLSRHDGGFSFHANGSVIDGHELAAVLKGYEQAEWDRDWAWVQGQYGDAAVPSLMPRTVQQRRYDAFMAMVNDAVATPPGSTPREPLVNLIMDDLTWVETVDLLFGYADHSTAPPPSSTGGSADSAGSPQRRRWSQTTDGQFVPPVEIVLAALRGQIRRVVTDRRGVVLDMGRRTRLFTGANRQAVLLSATRCTHPGCLVAASSSQADHLTPYSHGGRTITADAGPACGHHNRWRYTTRATTTLDQRGRWKTRRADGTDIAPPDHPGAAA